MQPISGSGTPRSFFSGDSANVHWWCIRSEGSVWRYRSCSAGVLNRRRGKGRAIKDRARGERESVGYERRKWEAEGEKGRERNEERRRGAERAPWLRIRLHRIEYKGLPNAASPVGPVTLLTCLLTCVVFLTQPVAHCSLVGHGHCLSGGPRSYNLESDAIPDSYYDEYFWK